MKIRTDYKICEYCGAALDVGEICDCRKPQEEKRLQGCMFYYTHDCKECVYNGEPLASVGNCNILKSI